MNILKNIYFDILNCSTVPPEAGGILGEKNGIICHFIFDKDLGSTECAVYLTGVNYIFFLHFNSSLTTLQAYL